MERPRTNPAEFEKFHKLLMTNAPDGYVPHYVIIRTWYSKNMDVSEPLSLTTRASFEKAKEYLGQGYNIAIYALETDDLLILDEDTEGAFPDVMADTLTVRTRRGTGKHYFYFDATHHSGLSNANISHIPNSRDPKISDGEWRVNDYYVIAAGGRVRGSDGIEGGYTVINEVPPAHIAFEQLPNRVREILRPEKKPEPKKKKGRMPKKSKSELWDFQKGTQSAELIERILTANDRDRSGRESRFPHPFHDSKSTGHNASVSVWNNDDGEEVAGFRCWHDNRYFPPLHMLYLWMLHEKDASKGFEDCEKYGFGCKGCVDADYVSLFDVNRDIEKVNELHAFAIEKDLIPDDDPPPFAKGKGDKEVSISIKEAVEAGFYDPNSSVADYDQFYEAIEQCVENKNEKGLWIIARATKCFLDGHVVGLAKWAVAEALFVSNRFATQEIIEPLMFWYNPKRGVYQHPAETRIRPLIRKQMPDASTALLQEVVAAIRDRTYREREDFDAPLHLICVKNGILDFDTGDLSPHTPDIIFLSNINAKYVEGADCPAFKKFLSEVAGSETDRLTLEEYIGFCLWRRYFLHVILMLLGDGRNGKTTFLNTVRAWLGKDNYSARNLRELTSQRFSMIDLYGKLANVSGEQGFEGGASISMGTLKDLSGEESVPFEPKFKGSVTGVNTAKLFFACNQVLISRDETLANWSRWLLLIFAKKFGRGEPETDENLIEKLTTEEERSGILNLAIEGLKRLKKKHNFSYNLRPDDVRELWATSANPAHGFILENLELDCEANDLSCDDLYRAFRVWSEAKGIKPIGKGKLTELLKAELAITKYQKGKEQVWCWRGIRFKPVEEKTQGTLDKPYP